MLRKVSDVSHMTFKMWDKHKISGISDQKSSCGVAIFVVLRKGRSYESNIENIMWTTTPRQRYIHV